MIIKIDNVDHKLDTTAAFRVGVLWKCNVTELRDGDVFTNSAGVNMMFFPLPSGECVAANANCTFQAFEDIEIFPTERDAVTWLNSKGYTRYGKLTYEVIYDTPVETATVTVDGTTYTLKVAEAIKLNVLNLKNLRPIDSINLGDVFQWETDGEVSTFLRRSGKYYMCGASRDLFRAFVQPFDTKQDNLSLKSTLDYLNKHNYHKVGKVKTTLTRV